jgi:transcription elongation factor Elf1|tara:strand:+ start:3629 stop:4630 length:1002 start_codon:yes stop_codon:yes gene_type:complete
MSYIDTKYLNIISPYLQQFKKKGDNLWNFRCPYCGDSKKSRTKARGFVFRKKNDLFFKCHNCGVGASLGNLVKTVDSKTYKDYIFERYKKGVETRSSPQPEFHFNAPVFRKKGILKTLKSISDLSTDHPARKIIEKRLIPFKSFSDIYLCESFYKFTNSIIPNKFPTLNGDHPRLLIPFRDEQGEVFAYQGRAFGNEQPKYITIKLDDDKDKIFGLDRVDKSKPIYVVEGPLDSLFLDNCIAVAGADFSNMKGDLIIIYDNEPRNKEINKQIEKTIDQGKSVCLWPDNMKWKDINDMIIAGYSKEQIQDIITNNTFSGASARLRFAEWRKINA